MPAHREPDKEDDTADLASLDSVGEKCSFCGSMLDSEGVCPDKWCPGSEDELDEEDFEEGLLGEGDDDA